MNENVSLSIRKAASKTFESLAFLEVFPKESTVETEQSGLMAVHLRVIKPFHGWLGLKTSKSFLAGVAQRLFALSASDISDEQLNDLLNELLNTIAGSFLATALPGDQPFSISLPLPGLGEGNANNLNMFVWNFASEAGDFTLCGGGEIIEKL